MFEGVFKKKNPVIEVDENGNIKKPKKNIRLLVIIICASVFVLAFSGNKNKDVPDTKILKDNSIVLNSSEYTRQIESDLESVLSAVKGVGKVKVRVSVSEYGEKVLATDGKKEINRESENDKNTNKTTEEHTALIYGSGTSEQPFVIKEKLPIPSGVLVVAEGGGNEEVKLEVYEAVKALYGISGHRIKVAQGQFK